jgi:2-polyprenyl-6-methoxyphenol hydroxylase-like FAD-dependent oxidoreductase
METIDVLIVGAGSVGMTLGIALSLLSLQIRVVDKAPATKREPRAAVIWQRTQEALAALGIIDKFEKEAYQLHSLDIYGDGSHLGTLELGHLKSEYPFPLIVEQHVTERLLAERLAEFGIRIEWETEATNVHLHEDYAEIALRRQDEAEETVTARWVVGCEGFHSIVHEKLEIPFEGQRRPNLQVVQVDAKPTWNYPESNTHGYCFLAENISMMSFPVPDGGNRFFAFTTDPAPSRKTPPSLEEMRDLITAVAHAPELRMELTKPLWLNRARFQDCIAATLRKGRALLAGDAAHVWAPIGGHGMNIGLRGAYNLGWKLAAVHRGEAKPHLLDTYSDEQKGNSADGHQRNAVRLLGATHIAHWDASVRDPDAAGAVARCRTALD